jgi:hypothetical protein
MDSAMQRRRSAISANSKKTAGESIDTTPAGYQIRASGGHDKGSACAAMQLQVLPRRSPY